MGDIVVVLGNRNDSAGRLSVAANARCAKAFEIFQSLPVGTRVVATGGFGDFNKSAVAHSSMIEDELQKLGIPRQAFLPRVVSNGTHQDAIGVLRQLFDEKFFGDVHVVTSTFHMARVRKIFGHFLASYRLTFHEIDHPVLAAEAEHELFAIAEFDRLKSNVAVAIESDSQDLDRMVSELRHYDVLSYYSLTASFLMIAYTFTRFSAGDEAPRIDFYSLLQFSLAVFISVGFLTIYERFADTAWIFRTAAKDLAFYLRRGDISTGPRTKLSGVKTRTWMQLVFSLGWMINLVQFFKAF